jgi:hypothetical protein
VKAGLQEKETQMRSFLVGLAAAATALGFATASGADPPQQATGSGVVGAPVPTNVRQADGNVLADITQSGVLTGTFSGTIQTTGRLIIHADGRVDVYGFVTFTGATPCGSGTVLFVGSDQTMAGVGSGTVRTVDAAANTVAIHSVDNLALVGSAFTYSGTYHCG